MTKRILTIISIAGLLFLTSFSDAFAAIKTLENVKPPKFESRADFQTDIFSGSAGYTYPIQVPQGTNELTPLLELSYNSHATRDSASHIGAGWQISRDYIERDVNFTPTYVTDDRFKLFLQGSSYDLIETSSGIYKTKVDSFLNIQKLTGAANDKGEYWQVITKEGTKYRFGAIPNSEIRCVNIDYITRWNVDEVTDTHANKIFYTYNESEPRSYVQKIEYNTEKARVVEFTYATNTNKRSSYYQGCKIEDDQRLTTISVKANNSLVRAYDFAYTDQSSGQPLLTSITQKGADGTSTLPQTKFEYKPQIKTWAITSEKWINNAPVDASISQPDVRVMDVTGDGYPDIVKSYENGHPSTTWKILRNNGNNGWSTTWETWVNSRPEMKGALLNHENVSLTDVTGDMLPDIVQSDAGMWRVWKNTGSSWDYNSSDWAHTPSIGNTSLDTGGQPNIKVVLADMNGDNLADIVKTKFEDNATDWTVYKNTGGGWTGSSQWMRPVEDSNLSNKNVRLADVTGDGLPDVVKSQSTDTWRVYKNNGNHLEGGYENWLNQADVDVILDRNSIQAGIADVNGDGLTDIIKVIDGGLNDHWQVLLNKGNKWSTTWETWIDPSSHVDVNSLNDNAMLIDVNGDGMTDILRSESNGGNNTWEVWKNNGLAPDLLSKVTTPEGGTISFDYKPSTKFNNTGSDGMPDLSFPLWVVEKMKTNNEVAGAHSTNATMQYGYAGGVYNFVEREFRGFGEVTVTDPNNNTTKTLFHQDTARKGRAFSTEIKDNQGRLMSKDEYLWVNTFADNINKVILEHEKKYTHDTVTENPKVTQTKYEYDAYGNVTKKSELGDLAINTDDRFSYTEFVYNTAAWIVNTPKHTFLRNSDDVTKVQEEWFHYDTHTGLDDAPTKGDLTKHTKWLEGGTNPVTTFEYDSFGNKTKEIDANNRATSYSFGIADATKTYPERVTNAKNQQTNSTYNLGTGNVNSTTDANGQTTSFEYDTFGKITKEIKPYDSSSQPTVSYQYLIDGIAPEGAKISKREVSGQAGTIDTYTFIDGLGRNIQTRAEAEDTTKQIVVNTIYNSLGQTEKQSVPHLDTLATSYVAPLANSKYSVSEYDALGRTTKVTNPDNTFKTSSYDHWTTNTTNERGNIAKKYQNAFENIIQVDEINGASTYVTKYTYNARNNLVKITDAANNMTDFTFDTLSRKTKQVDPDMGTWNYQYDAVGNVTKQTDNRGIAVNRTYDELNRLKTVDYPNDTDTAYTYDTGKAGTLAQVVDASGTVNFTYDNRLRKTQEQRVVDGITLTTQFAYDALDRVTTRTNPDSEVITYTFNSQGEIDKVNGIVNNIDYNALGKVAKKDYANNLSTNYTYNTTDFRLNKIQTGSLQNLNYTYDPIGNVATINNSLTSKTQEFGYDPLDRLTTAKEIGGYDYSYQYNPIGNLTKFTKDGTAIDYTYGQNAGVHALTSSTETAAPPSGNNYTGEYFDNKTLTGAPKLTRQDAAISFDWQGGSPDPLIPADNFSVRWTKEHTFEAGDYKFTTNTDDGVRLYIDNVLVIDKWVDQPLTEHTATKTMTAGAHTIKVEYYENGWGAAAGFSFEKLASSEYTFYKGINFNGNAVTIDGNAWQSMSQAQASGLSFPSGHMTATTSWTPNPSANADTSAMLNSVIWNGGNTIAIDQTVTNGDYQVYLWVMENYADNNRKFNVKTEGVQVGTGIGYLPKTHWVKYGPYNATVGDGVLDVDLVKDIDAPHVSGMAIYKKTAGSTPTPTPTPPPSGEYTFLKGINFNGNAVTIEGNNWLSMSQAMASGLSFPSGYATGTTSLTPSPAVDSATAAMFNSVVWNNGNTVNMNQTLTNGDYQVYLWVMENHQDYYRKFNVKLEGTQVATEIGHMPKTNWLKYGPYNVTVADGTLNIDLIKVLTDPHIEGMTIYKKTTGTPAPTPTASPTPIPTPTATPTPAPTPTPPPSALYPFEDGTVMGWDRGEQVTAVGNSADQAFAGTKSLKVHVNFPGGGWSSGYLFVGSSALTANKTITAKVYVPAGASGLSSSIYLQDSGWAWRESGQFALTPGQWNTISWNVTGISFSTPVNRFGFHIGSNNANNLDIYFDNIDIVQ